MSRADSRLVAAVVACSLVGLALRLVALGERPFHWDEARVGVWALRFARTGAFEYRPVAGGPLPYHLARASLALFSPSDLSARLPVALVGGLLPLSALGLRTRLSDRETALLAAFLALSPPLVYYGRVLRGDLLLAAAAFVACVSVVRVVDTNGPARRRFAYVAVLAAAAALAASGFVVATVACVVAAGSVVLDARRLSFDALVSTPARLRARSTLLARLFLVGVAAVVFLFAPRGGSVSLWNPLSLPGVLGFVFVEAPGRFFAVRVASRSADGVGHALLPFVVSLGRTLLAAAPVTLLCGLVGFFHERYAGSDRPAVALFAVWAGAGLLLFPAVAEVDAPWTAVHVVVPLAVPAAVGLARGVDVVQAAVAREDAAVVASALLVASAGVAGVGAVFADDVYGSPTPESALAGYAQPADGLDPFAANLSGGKTVLYYGDRVHTRDWNEADGPPVPESWGTRLPLPWYVAREGASSTSLPSGAPLPAEPPAVVVTVPEERERLGSELTGYEASGYRLALWNREVVVFVRRS
ncbi:TIGR03663 family protein [Salinigranum rubrum]|uniref:TIGR03663 family protein n=1 Tax=Salinigranum rubrum TaxID=755307 RepID=A0A2I8VIN9_9EURY|nr:flippase activity-associated protein Agl23 [Salinigranum rubrum]AUV81775.1 TIGR03663 family protein [Salinigranum rubrum]